MVKYEIDHTAWLGASSHVDREKGPRERKRCFSTNICVMSSKYEALKDATTRWLSDERDFTKHETLEEATDGWLLCQHDSGKYAYDLVLERTSFASLLVHEIGHATNHTRMGTDESSGPF